MAEIVYGLVAGALLILGLVALDTLIRILRGPR